MQVETSVDRSAVGAALTAMRPSAGRTPDVTVVVPVNAQGDLEKVPALLGDISRYDGPASVEVVLVVNNYPAAEPPAEIERFERLGVRVVAVPSVRRADRPGEAVCLSARMPGVRAASSDCVVLFDADCRIPNIAALLDWYREQFRRGARASYTAVGYYGLPGGASIRVRFAIHHAARWVKRNLLGIPTTRGSNYAVHRESMIALYDGGYLADDFNVGPAFREFGLPITYSSRRALTVYTSGRMFRRGWKRILPYYWYRLRYNLRVLPVRPDAQRFTERERRDPKDRYTYRRRLNGT
jgi:hypothetical protein